MVTLYGIPHRDTVKGARAWLVQRQLAFVFHDFKKLGVPAQRAVCDAASAQALMLEQPSSIKRPVVEWGARITVGFDAASWAAALDGVAGYH